MAARDPDRRDGKDRREGPKRRSTVRAWLALLGTAVGAGGGMQIGQQRAETNMTQDSAKMFMHTRDREVDVLRAETDRRFGEVVHQIERFEDRTKCP